LEGVNKVNLKNIKKFLKTVASSKQLIIELNKLYTPLLQTDISASQLGDFIKSNHQHIIGTTLVFKKM